VKFVAESNRGEQLLVIWRRATRKLSWLVL